MKLSASRLKCCRLCIVCGFFEISINESKHCILTPSLCMELYQPYLLYTQTKQSIEDYSVAHISLHDTALKPICLLLNW